MQLQQLHVELRKLRRELDHSYEAREDLQDELKEMTSMYLNAKQERDKYKQYVDQVKRDVDNIEKIVRDNVERAVRQKDKQIQDMIGRLKEQQDRVGQLEAHKECYGNTIRQLEEKLLQMGSELEAEQEKNLRLSEQLVNGGSQSEEDLFSMVEEKARMKRLQVEDDYYLRKINDADNIFGMSGSNSKKVRNNNAYREDDYTTGHPNLMDQTAAGDQLENKENIQTTQFDADDSADEATNVRLKEESSMMFDFGGPLNNSKKGLVTQSMRGKLLKQPVNTISPNHVQLDVRRSAQFDGQVIRPGSSDGSSTNSTGSHQSRLEKVIGSAKKTIQNSFLMSSAKKTPSRVTPAIYQKLNMKMRSSKQVEEQKVPKTSNVGADFMLSQDSIKQFELEAEQETIHERDKLQSMEKNRREFAKKLRETQDEEFRAKQDQTKQDRLKYLLKQSEIFTHFILQNGKKGPGALQMSDVDLIRKGKGDSGAMGGKTSVSKRHLKKQSRKQESLQDEDADEVSSDQVITRLSAQPTIMKGGVLRDYQLDGLNWLISLYETGLNGILADEMGLGKTVQTISMLSFLREFKHIKGYHMVIVPKSCIPNWMNEFKRWCPDMKVVNLIARKEFREDILANDLQPGKFDVVVTTFEGCRICLNHLMKFKWEYLIVDEAHKIKNEESQISKKLRQLDTRYRLLLTGTPLQNNLHELWALLNFLLPEVFTSSEEFDEWFDLSGGQNVAMTDEEKERRNTEIVQQLHKILRPFMLRRIKKEVEKNLPPKVEVHVTVGITEQQKSIYRQLLKKSTIEKGSSVSFYKNIIIQLRKIVNHPYLFDNQEPEGAEEFGEHIIQASGKMIFLDKLLKKMKEEQNQCLIFSGFTSMLDILEDYCLFREYKYCRLDGNTDLDERERYIDEFTKPDSEKFIFLISTRAGGLGLNLMTANIVVLYDSDWNPQIDLQAMDRAHRIGQKKVVQVFRLITQQTMEEKMIEKQTMKLKLDSLIIQKGRLAPKHTGLQKEELQDMVNFGADEIFRMGSTNISDEDIDQLIKKGLDRAETMQKKAENIIKDKFNMLDFQMNTVNMYQFEDVDYLQEKRKEQEKALKKHVVEMLNEEVRMGRREKKNANLNLNESKLFPKFYQGGQIGVSNEAKKKKLLKIQDFRFFPKPERLKYLLEKELEAKYTSYLQGIEQVIFTEDERKEKDKLWDAGFHDWDRRDYQRFCQALEFYSPDDYESIARHIGDTKTAEDIAKYAPVFLTKIDSLADAEKIRKNMEKADKIIQFKKKAPHIIKQKVQAYENPYDEMTLHSSTQKSKYFTKESDILLLIITDQIGYGKWREIKQAIRRDIRARFDHLFLSRSELDLQRRVDILVKGIEKEDLDKIARKPSFEDVADKMMQALNELRIQDSQMQAELEEQRRIKRAAALAKQNSAQSKGINQDDSSMIKVPEEPIEGDEPMEDDEINQDTLQQPDVVTLSENSNIEEDVEMADPVENSVIKIESSSDEELDEQAKKAKKFKHLEREADLRVGYGKGKYSDEEEEDDPSRAGGGGERPSAKKKPTSAKKKKANSNHGSKNSDGKLKQTRLIFTGGLAGKKRGHQESSLGDQDLEEIDDSEQ